MKTTKWTIKTPAGKKYTASMTATAGKVTGKIDGKPASVTRVLSLVQNGRNDVKLHR